MLVTLQQAVRHLRLSHIVLGGSPASDDELDLTLKIEMAEAIILDYLKFNAGSPSPWTDELDTPPVVQAAILLQLGELWRFRGDDPGSIESAPTFEDGQLSKTITHLLRRYRDPALA